MSYNKKDSFRYRTVLEKGKPVHDKNDSFRIKHPPMDLSRRAKIFSPFDALKGFGEELSRAEAEASKACPGEDTGREETMLQEDRTCVPDMPLKKISRRS